MDYDKRRKDLFGIYSENFNRFRNLVKWEIEVVDENKLIIKLDRPLLACPLCLRFFDSRALNQNSSDPLSLEDVPPDSLGGNKELLSCKACNNLSGGLLDSQVLRDMQLFTFGKGKNAIDVKAGIDDNNLLSAHLKLDLDTNSIHFQFPDYPFAKAQLNALKAGGDHKINFKIYTPQDEKKKRGLLRIGHLMAYRYFGNSYLFSAGSFLLLSKIGINVKPELLGQFNNPNFEPLFFSDDSILPQMEGMHIITEPLELGSALAVFTLKLEGESKTIGVLIPGPTTYHVDNYLSYGNKATTATMIELEGIDFLSNCALYFDMWNNVNPVPTPAL